MRTFILGTDWWTDCDDAVALRILARAALAGEIRLAGIGINGCMEHSVPSLEGFLNTEGLTGIPLGLDREATDFGGNPPYQKRLAQYARAYPTNEAAEDALALYLRRLREAEEPVELIEIGYPQVLAALVTEYPALVREKVSHIWVMAGKWDEDPGLENNFCRNPRSRRAGNLLCKNCPVPMTFLGWETGFDVISGSKLQSEDVLLGALTDHGSPHGRSSWDPMLVLLALAGDPETAGYTSVRGWARVDPDTGANHFEKSANGGHRYVVRRREAGFYAETIDQRIASR